METYSKVISVIIPSLHSTYIDQTLGALHKQNFDLNQVEVLVVGLDKYGLIKQDKLVRFISTEVPVSPATARNIGIQYAKGDILCFTDADCLPDRNWLRELTRLFSHKIHVVGGGVVFDTNKSYWNLCDNFSWFYDLLVSSPVGERHQLASLNLAVHRHVIETVGLLNETYPNAAAEDSEWTVRMRMEGYKLYFNPAAVVGHYPFRTSLTKLWWHSFTYGRYSVKVNPRFMDFLSTPVILRHWLWWALAFPLASVLITVKILWKNRTLPRIWLAAPGIFISKIAWSLGALSTLKNQNT